MDRDLVRKLLDDAGATRNRDVLGDILRERLRPGHATTPTAWT